MNQIHSYQNITQFYINLISLKKSKNIFTLYCKLIQRNLIAGHFENISTKQNY